LIFCDLGRLRFWFCNCVIHCTLTIEDTLLGGWAGYFSYDTVRYAEKKKLPFSNAPVDDRNLCDMHLGLYESLIVFDHVEKVPLQMLSQYNSVILP